LERKLDKMTPKERILSAYRCREVDRIPIVVERNPYDNTHWMQKEPSYAPLREIMKRADVTGSWSPTHNLHSVLSGLKIDGKEFKKESISARDGHYGKITKYPIEREEDLNLLLKYEDYKIPQKEDFSRYYELKKEIGENGVIYINLPEYIDFLGENILETEFSILSLTALEKMEELIKRISSEYERFLKYILENTVDKDDTIVYFYGPEFALPPLVRPEVFDKLYKYDQPLVDLVHSYKGLVHIHSHGKVKNYIRKFKESKADILNPIEPSPMGDVTVSEALKIANGEMAIQGGIEFGDIEAFLNKKEVEEKVLSILQEAKNTKINGFLLGLTAEPVKNRLDKKMFENYVAFIESGRKYGGKR